MTALVRALRRPDFWCVAVIAGACAWTFSATLFSDRILGAQDVLLYQAPFVKPPELARPSNEGLFDTFYQFQPDMLEGREDLRAGRLPSWTPNQGAGQPLLATQQHALLYPVNWLASVLPFWQSLEWLAFLKLLLAGAGAFVLLRMLGLRRPAAAFGGVSFALSAFMVDWVEHPHVNSYALMPWAVAAAERLARRRRVADALLLALVVGAAALGGHPPSMIIALLPALLWFAVRRPGLRAAALFALALVLGAAVGAVMLIPFFEAGAQSNEFTRGAGGSPRAFLFGFFAPELWGRPDKAEIAGGPINYMERTAYFGAIPLVLAVGGLAARRTPPQVFFAVIALMALGFAVDLARPWTELGGELPVLDRMNRSRLLVVCAFAGCVLGAYGLHHLLEERGRRRRLLLAAALAAAALPLLWLTRHPEVRARFGEALGQLPNIQQEPLERGVLQMATFLRWSLFAGLGLALALAAALRPRLATAAAAAIVVVAAFDVASFARGFHAANPGEYGEPPVPQAVRYLQRKAGHQRVAGKRELGPNVAQRYDLRDARSYNLPPLGRRAELWKALGGSGTSYYESLGESASPAVGRVANQFAVRYLISYDLEGEQSPRWPGVPEAHPVVENPEAFPRAFVAYGVRPATGKDDALAQLVAGTDRQALVAPVVEGAAAPARGLAVTPARFADDDDGEVVLEARAARPGRLVLLDTWYPGWKATVDGREAAIEHANVAFRSVRVPAGEHTVRFTYEPLSVRAGALVSLAAVAAIVLGLARPALRRRSRTPRRASRPAAGSGPGA